VATRDKQLPEPDRRTFAEQYTAWAIELLKKLRSADLFKNESTRVLLKEDHDLDPLRSRPDFQELVREIEADAS
jgi:hypothetical protein